MDGGGPRVDAHQNARAVKRRLHLLRQREPAFDFGVIRISLKEFFRIVEKHDFFDSAFFAELQQFRDSFVFRESRIDVVA